ncbi:MAG: DUF1854 domain-containing protein [Anaerolineae bacterium]
MEEIKPATIKSFVVVHLQPEDLQFERNGDTLSLTMTDGRRFPRVVLRSCFPVSQHTLLLSVRDATAEEQPEIGIIDDWMALKEGSLRAVTEEMTLHYFVPQITKITKVKKEFGFIYWTVDTDKGPKDFVMRDSVVHYAREVARDRWLIIDVNQARYEIPDVEQMDARSRKLVHSYLYL